MSKPRTLSTPKPANFDFTRTVQSHGWYDLLPFQLSESPAALSFVASDSKGEMAECRVTDSPKAIRIRIENPQINADSVKRQVRHTLRLDEDFDTFYTLLHDDAALHWVRQHASGRLLRSPTVFEDLVKTICTTNCSWAMTKIMVTNLVEKLGEAVGRRKAFPTAASMATMPVVFYRDEIRAGYRSAYFVELAESVAAGDLDPQSWLHSELSTPDLKKEIKKVKGVGDYAAENLLKLLGRYDGLALDSWLRAQFYKKHCGGTACEDKKIAKHYHHFGEWKGLAIWCDMTEDWFS